MIFFKKMGWHTERCALDTRHRWDGRDWDLRLWRLDGLMVFVWVCELKAEWVFDGFETVCSLTILYRRKRNVGGIVCGWSERSDCHKELWRTRFLIRTMLPDFDLWSKLVCKICSRQFERDQKFASCVLHRDATDYSHLSNFQLESLILAQNERWRQA